MANQLTRRFFLASASAFAVMRSVSSPAVSIFDPSEQQLGGMDTVPADLDHILLGASDLDEGIAWMEQRCGVRAVHGGVHPGRGTRNALLSLGSEGARRYLEIIAPDSVQTKPNQSQRKSARTQGENNSTQQLAGPISADELSKLKEPKLLRWVVHTSDIDAIAKTATLAGMTFNGPRDGSRARPDGKTVRWKTLMLENDFGRLLPFFIEWDPQSIHPSQDSPKGCRLERFVVRPSVNQAHVVADAFAKLDLNVMFEPAEAPGLRAQISSPKGEFELR